MVRFPSDVCGKLRPCEKIGEQERLMDIQKYLVPFVLRRWRGTTTTRPIDHVETSDVALNGRMRSRMLDPYATLGGAHVGYACVLSALPSFESRQLGTTTVFAETFQ